MSRTRVGGIPFGFLPVDKPAGPTSHDIVSVARRALLLRKVGHAGTLDPFASGLLLLAVGATTRLMEYLHPLDKEYLATVRLGETTETLDPESDVAFVSDRWSGLDEEEIRNALSSFRGAMDQMPPAFSAKKVGGEPAYRRARRGENVVLRTSRITIHDVELLSLSLPEVTFRLRCSTGTYVRSLARDLGERLRVGAYLSALRRTAIGPFRVEGALPPADLHLPETVDCAMVAPRQALSHLPELELPDPEFRRLCHGQSLPLGDLSVDPNSLSVEEGPLLVHSPGWRRRVVVSEWRIPMGAAGVSSQEASRRNGTANSETEALLRPIKVVGDD